MCGPNNPGCGCAGGASDAREVRGLNAGGQVYTPVRFITSPSQASSVRAAGYFQPGAVPTMLPGQRVYTNGHVALYEDLYGAVDAYNNPAVAAYPGTWGGHFAAGKAR